VDVPDVEYARSGEVAIAYQIFGEGPVDLVFARGFAGDLLTTWEQPPLVRQLQSFAAIARVLMLDKRGTGLSDGFRQPPTLETRMDDLRLVMDAVGSERAALWSAQDGARLALLFAATYPERTAGLVLYDPHATSLRDDDYPWAPSDEEWRRRLADAREGWGTVEYFRRLVEDWAPERVGDGEFLDWFVRHMRRSLSPGAAVGFLRATMGADVRDVLAARASRHWCWRRPTGANRRRTSPRGSITASLLCCRPCEDSSRGSTWRRTNAQWTRPSAS
jgi:pimeloyl-ACP methyl ester carboxylesterase